ncbi:hypothetical protein MPER_07462 [Moniliophthora perniciosa FA553]|nr:hypothetical protein MPER_07462 [Moniliophthora perniciosa FA553]
MPAHRKHKSKVQQLEAERAKSKRYYERKKGRNAEKSVDRGRSLTRKARLEQWDASNLPERMKEWESVKNGSVIEDRMTSLSQLRTFQEHINRVVKDPNTWMENIYKELSLWFCSVERSKESPMKHPMQLGDKMLHAVRTHQSAVLNEYGVGKEWREAERLTTRIRTFVHCLEDMEMALMSNELDEKHDSGKLLYQGKDAREWLSRNVV